MGDHTLAGVVGIVAVVLIVAVSMNGGTQSQSTDQNAAGFAFDGTPAADQAVFEEKTYCAGSKLVQIQSDGDVRNIRCKFGCDAVRATCR